MKDSTFKKISGAITLVNNSLYYIIAAIFMIIVGPFYLCYIGIQKLLVCLHILNEYDNRILTKKERKKMELKSKAESRQISLENYPHTTTDTRDRFLFYENRKLILPCDALVYIENEYNEELHKFFDENKEWIEHWSAWHGWDIIEVDYEDIKEGMVFPQDFKVFRHGFLWRSPCSSSEKEYDIFGNIHYYYDLNPSSEVPIKQQMKDMMQRIHSEFHI